MKKNIFLTLGAAVLMTACSDDYKDWVAPTTTDAPASTSTLTLSGGGTVTPVTDVIDFADFAEGQTLVRVCDINAAKPAEGVTKGDDIIVFDNESSFVLTDGQMAVSELRSYIEGKWGKAPYERTIDAYVYTTYTNGKVSTRSYSDTFQLTAQLVAPHISENYYVIGGTLDWAGSAASKEMKFQHSDQNVYDDPIFTITIPLVDGADTWFAIGDDEALDAITNEGNWSKLLGTTAGNGNSGLEGFLAPRSELSDDGSFMIPAGGKFAKITLDMMNASYSIEIINFDPFIYFIGSTDGWVNSNQKLAHQGDGLYTGYCYVADPNGWGLAFKFQRQPGSWDNEINAGTFTTKVGVTGDNNIEVYEAGVYYFNVNLSENSITAVKMDNMNLVGDFNGWNPADDAQQMTWNANDFCYEITGAGVTENGWKFTANNGWDINLGGATDNLVANGDNLSAVGTTIKLYPCRTTSDNIFCTIE